MKIFPISNSVNSKGLYFTDVSNVIYRPNGHLRSSGIADSLTKISETGIKYVENPSVAQSIKDRFAQAPVIKKLIKDGKDIFVFFRELPKENKNNAGYDHFSFAEINWDAGEEKSVPYKCAPRRVSVCGNSSKSCKQATENMLENLESNKFMNPNENVLDFIKDLFTK